MLEKASYVKRWYNSKTTPDIKGLGAYIWQEIGNMDDDQCPDTSCDKPSVRAPSPALDKRLHDALFISSFSHNPAIGIP
jgi:hypothetical protein